MSGRIASAFEAARLARRAAFVPFLTAGFPDAGESLRLASALCEEGADILELGVPFSDPLADGPVIQRASETALRAGATLTGALDLARQLRERRSVPLVLMSYLNPVLRLGVGTFAREAAAAGVDGVLLVDLPPEEDPGTWDALRASGLDTIAMVSPTTDSARIAAIARRASGYLYVVARLGVTGRGGADPEIGALLRSCREVSPLPRCLGFGFDLSSDMAPLRGAAEGIIVGSALLAPLLEARDGAVREALVRSFARAFRPRLDGWTPG